MVVPLFASRIFFFYEPGPHLWEGPPLQKKEMCEAEERDV